MRRQVSNPGAARAVNLGNGNFRVIDWGESRDKPHLGITFVAPDEMDEEDLAIVKGEKPPRNSPQEEQQQQQQQQQKKTKAPATGSTPTEPGTGQQPAEPVVDTSLDTPVAGGMSTVAVAPDGTQLPTGPATGYVPGVAAPPAKATPDAVDQADVQPTVSKQIYAPATKWALDRLAEVQAQQTVASENKAYKKGQLDAAVELAEEKKLAAKSGVSGFFNQVYEPTAASVPPAEKLEYVQAQLEANEAAQIALEARIEAEVITPLQQWQQYTTGQMSYAGTPLTPSQAPLQKLAAFSKEEGTLPPETYFEPAMTGEEMISGTETAAGAINQAAGAGLGVLGNIGQQAQAQAAWNLTPPGAPGYQGPALQDYINEPEVTSLEQAQKNRWENMTPPQVQANLAALGNAPPANYTLDYNPPLRPSAPTYSPYQPEVDVKTPPFSARQSAAAPYPNPQVYSGPNPATMAAKQSAATPEPFIGRDREETPPQPAENPNRIEVSGAVDYSIPITPTAAQEWAAMTGFAWPGPILPPQNTGLSEISAVPRAQAAPVPFPTPTQGMAPTGARSLYGGALPEQMQSVYSGGMLGR